MKRHRVELEEHSAAERWTVSYADFMTLLFALFVVLFASSRHDKQDIQKVSSAVHKGFEQLGAVPHETLNNGPPVAGVEPPRITRSGGVDLLALQSDLTAALGQEIARKEIVLRMTPDGFIISLRELGFFQSGKAAMLPGADGKIKRLGEVLTKYGLNMRVEGHTDDVPIHTQLFHSNWDLSIARADSVAMMLIDEGHFDPGHLAIVGCGQYHPAADNSSAQGRQANRRVDIVIVTTTKPPGGP